MDGPNFFCFISPKAPVNKSTVVKGPDPISNHDNSLDTCLLIDNDSLSCAPAQNTSQTGVIQVKMGQDISKGRISSSKIIAGVGIEIAKFSPEAIRSKKSRKISGPMNTLNMTTTPDTDLRHSSRVVGNEI